MLKNVMSNSTKPIKFVHLQRLANQSLLNGALVIEWQTHGELLFMKAWKNNYNDESIKTLDCSIKREKISLKKKTEGG